MPHLIINADDFGLTLGVTQGIIACDANGVTLSTSAMTCVAGAGTIVRENAGRFGGGIGLHLQLTQGAPVLPVTEVPTLVGGGDCFPTRRPEPGLSASEVTREWKAQLERLLSWGIEPDHLDSHHHVHGRSECGPELLSVYAAFAKELRLPARSGSRAVAAFLKAKGVACPDVVVPLSEFDANIDVLMGLLEAERAAGPADLVVEIGCHPGFADDELATLTLPKYCALREKELRVLLHPDIHSRFRKAGWTVIRYNELATLKS